MAFLRKVDYFTVIRENVLDEITKNSDLLRTTVELNVEEEIKSYLQKTYDLTTAFINVLTWSVDGIFTTGDFVQLIADEFDESEIYTIDDIVSYNGFVYINILDPITGITPEDDLYWTNIGLVNSLYSALQDTPTGGVLINDLSFWQPGDVRNQLLLRYYIDIVIYELHSRINSRNIPDLRIKRRDEAIIWLDKVSDPRNNITPDLPLKVHEENKGNDISWGSNPKKTHGY